jgi:hypothetical protein
VCARSIAVLGPAYSILAVFIPKIAAFSLPLRNQQAVTPAVPAAALSPFARITEDLSQDYESIKEAAK